MARYLLTFSYIGTRYSGMQRQLNVKGKTVQDVLERMLGKLKSAIKPNLTLSSRTDKGVHALMSTAHCDLHHEHEDRIYEPNHITRVLSRALRNQNEDIIIMNTRFVTSTFHARFNAKWRAYRYRIAILKDDVPCNFTSDKLLHVHLPITELYRCELYRPPLDIDKVHQVLDLFTGTHNFATFHKSASGDYQPDPTKTINEFLFYPVNPHFSKIYDPQYDKLEFWEFYVRSKSFLYHQVRRMIGAALAVARGVVTLDDVRWMLENPSPQNWNSRVIQAPAYGLYLSHIEYDEKEMELTPEEEKNISSLKPVGWIDMKEFDELRKELELEELNEEQERSQ